MKSFKGLIFLALAVAIISGCSTMTPSQTLKSENGEKVSELRLEPYLFSGARETEGIRTGRVIIIICPLSNRLIGGEYAPGRSGFEARIANKNGREFDAQVLFAGYLRQNGKENPMGFVIIEGTLEELGDDPRGMILSTRLAYGYDFSTQESSLSGKSLKNEPRYRFEKIREKGSSVLDCVQYPEFLEIIRGWNRYQTPQGVILSPLSEDKIKILAKYDPKYTYWQKLTSSWRLMANYSPASMAISLGFDFIMANFIPDQGLDFGSREDRRSFALRYEFLENLRNEASAKFESGKFVPLKKPTKK